MALLFVGGFTMSSFVNGDCGWMLKDVQDICLLLLIEPRDFDFLKPTLYQASILASLIRLCLVESNKKFGGFRGFIVKQSRNISNNFSLLGGQLGLLFVV